MARLTKKNTGAEKRNLKNKYFIIAGHGEYGIQKGDSDHTS